MSDRPSTLVSRSAMEMVFALVTMVFGATVVSGALEFSIGWGEIGPEAGYFPFRIGTLIVLASLVNLVRAVKRRRAAVETILTGEEGRRLVAFALPVLAFVGIVMVLGVYVASALYLSVRGPNLSLHEFMISLFIAITTPVASHLLAKAAKHRNVPGSEAWTPGDQERKR